jgi:hypothetical protein
MPVADVDPRRRHANQNVLGTNGGPGNLGQVKNLVGAIDVLHNGTHCRFRRPRIIDPSRRSVLAVNPHDRLP